MADQKTSIVITAEDKTQAALASVRNGMQGLQGAFAGLDGIASRIPMLGGALAAAFGAVSFTGIVKGAIDAADELNDLSQKLGISVEDLAGFKLAAEQSGTSLEGVATGVKRLSVYMAENGDKLRAAGISATDAKGALVQLADQFSRMQDGPEKTAIAIKLLGKAGADLIPMLNGGGQALQAMLEKGQQLNPVTKAMAEEADKFNDSMTELNTSVKGLAITLAGPLLSAMNSAIDNFKKGREAGLGFWQAVTGVGVRDFGEDIDDAKRNSGAHIAELRKEISDLEADRDRQLKFGSTAGAASLQVAIDNAQKKLAYYKALQVDFLAANNKASYSNEGHGRELKPTIGGILDDPEKKAKAAKAKKGNIFDPEGDFFAAVDEKLFEAQKKAATDAAAAVDKYDEALKKSAESLYAATGVGQWDKLNDELDKAQEAFDRGFINQDKLDAINSKLLDTTDALKGQKDIAKELGMTFTSAFEDAVIGGKKFSEVLTSLGNDILRLVMRKKITEPFAKAVSDFDFGSFFKANADGGVYAGPGISAYSGSVVSRPTVFPFASGIGLMGEAGPEAILPLKRGSNGKLGIEGGGSNVVVNIIESPGNGGKQEQRQQGGVNILDVFVEKIKSSIAGDISDGRGAIPAAMSSSFGLNRAAGAF